jgi:flavodoxin
MTDLLINDILNAEQLEALLEEIDEYLFVSAPWDAYEHAIESQDTFVTQKFSPDNFNLNYVLFSYFECHDEIELSNDVWNEIDKIISRSIGGDIDLEFNYQGYHFGESLDEVWLIKNGKRIDGAIDDILRGLLS